ncbi:MAG: Xaa-Pro peptidase family protein [Methylacidiphilales bacterium]|nr:Xaa-Pro peptidase family protein [Candidatus Methylacidiphilales bacterium]MDW8348650.1 Xaa-Pro peptidase family protein [Verrucomicrobiae bacterium]
MTHTRREKTARLMVAASERDADMLYATRFMAPDAFIWWEWKGITKIAINRLEIDRARKEARVDEVLPIESFPTKDVAKIIHQIALKEKFKRIEVPRHFPHGLAVQLEQLGIQVVAKKESLFFHSREIKTADEVKAITRAQRMAEAGLFRAIEVLRESSIAKNKKLIWQGRPLTSERLRGEIESTIVKLGGLPSGTIVAGGVQACDPHERGHGPLKAHESIIIDIFPRETRSGYFGDLTRTVVRGRASEALRELFHLVKEAQSLALNKMKPGVDGKTIHEEIEELFKKRGYPTELRQGRWVGFFHGTGHSLGLEIHESPRFSAAHFRPGHIMTVEPGLYYPEIGGVRIEDVVQITNEGVRNLTRAAKTLEIV